MLQNAIHVKLLQYSTYSHLQSIFLPVAILHTAFFFQKLLILDIAVMTYSSKITWFGFFLQRGQRFLKTPPWTCPPCPRPRPS